MKDERLKELLNSRRPLTNTKLTQEEVNAIRESTDTAKFLSFRFRVSRSTISMIKNNKSWI